MFSFSKSKLIMARSTEALSTKTSNGTNMICKELFMTLVNDKELNIYLKVINLILKKEMDLDITKLDQQLAGILPYMFIVYVKKWEGWQLKNTSYKNGEISIDEYYEKFHNYLKFKINHLITMEYKTVIKELSKKESTPFAPYSLTIECPPKLVNTLVFDSHQNDLVLTPYNGAKWVKLSTAELINWPNIEVNFYTETLAFCRRNVSVVDRYINLSPNSQTLPKESDENIENKWPAFHRKCHTYDELAEYVNEYISIFKMVPNIAESQIEEVSTILSSFLNDIKDINMKDTIATGTAIEFRFRSGKYTRILKTVDETQPSKQTVEYVEIITPKMEVYLNFFCAVKEYRDGGSYQNITKMIKAISRNRSLFKYLPVIKYTCTFCKITFDSKKSKLEILEHLQRNHSMELPVYCLLCHKFFCVSELAGLRWLHHCEKNKV